MENRLRILTIVAVLWLADSIVSAQSFGIPAVPCTAERGCADPRLPRNARCQAGFCICTDETSGAPKNCTFNASMEPKSAGHNSAVFGSCKDHRDCTLPHEICNTTRSQCACDDGYVMADHERKCLVAASELGSSCEEDAQCQKTMANTFCKNEQCVCSPGHHHSGNNTCSRTVGFGDSCANHEECSHTENAVCDERTSFCRCSDKSTLDSNGEKCLLLVARIFDDCVERAQCAKPFPNSDCIDKRCRCTNENHYDPSTSECIMNRNLGEECSGDFQCYQEDQETDIPASRWPQRCHQHICVCNENFVRTGDICSAAGPSLVPGILSLISAIFLFSGRS